MTWWTEKFKLKDVSLGLYFYFSFVTVLWFGLRTEATWSGSGTCHGLVWIACFDCHNHGWRWSGFLYISVFCCHKPGWKLSRGLLKHIGGSHLYKCWNTMVPHQKSKINKFWNQDLSCSHRRMSPSPSPPPPDTNVKKWPMQCVWYDMFLHKYQYNAQPTPRTY